MIASMKVMELVVSMELQTTTSYTYRFTGYGAGVSVILCIHHQLHNPLLLWIISTGYHGAGGDDYIISNLEIMYLLVTISSIILELLMSATIVKNYK